MERVYGEGEIRVNSMHHMAIDEVAPGFAVTARCPDGVVEAIESTMDDWFALGTQFHPESDSASALDLRIFEEFAVGIVERLPKCAWSPNRPPGRQRFAMALHLRLDGSHDAAAPWCTAGVLVSSHCRTVSAAVVMAGAGHHASLVSKQGPTARLPNRGSSAAKTVKVPDETTALFRSWPARRRSPSPRCSACAGK